MQGRVFGAPLFWSEEDEMQNSRFLKMQCRVGLACGRFVTLMLFDRPNANGMAS
jgi:hypothetical protein